MNSSRQAAKRWASIELIRYPFGETRMQASSRLIAEATHRSGKERKGEDSDA
jgi:hypothetical protein